MRGARLALLSLAGGVALAVPASGAVRATAPPTPPPVTTTGSPGATAPPPVTTAVAGGQTATSVPGATSTTVVLAPEATLPRAGAAIGDLDRQADEETWSIRRLVTATALGIAALALAGYVYGRLQSVTPRVGRTIARPTR